MLLTSAICPECRSPQVLEQDDPPWCERCEWNLAVAKDDPYRGPLGRRFDRWARKFGYRLNQRLFREIAERGPRRPVFTAATLVLGVVSVLMAILLLGLLGGAALMIVGGNVAIKLLGVIALIVVVALRPRLGRLKEWRKEYDEITRQEAPHLFGLLDRCEAGIGSPCPDHVFLGAEWNAMTSLVGLRRRKVMMLGLPLWTALQPQERVALLGHELGHFVNKDVRRGLTTQLACTFFGNLADLVRPVPMVDSGGLVMMLGRSIARVLQWALAYLCLYIHLGILLIAARQSQRAEYYADQLAAQLSGTLAIGSLMDVLTRSVGLMAVAGSRARGRADARTMREAIAEQRAQSAERLPRLRLLTLRDESSPFSSHPPSGLRHRMASVHAYQQAKVVLTDAEAERIDAELERYHERYRRIIAEAW